MLTLRSFDFIIECENPVKDQCTRNIKSNGKTIRS